MILIYKYADVYIVKEKWGKYVLTDISVFNNVNDIIVCNCYLDLDNRNNVFDIEFINYLFNNRYNIYYKNFRDCYNFIDIFEDIFLKVVNRREIRDIMNFMYKINKKVKLEIDRVKYYNNGIKIDLERLKKIRYRLKNGLIMPNFIVEEGVLIKILKDGIEKKEINSYNELLVLLDYSNVNYIYKNKVFYRI